MSRTFCRRTLAGVALLTLMSTAMAEPSIARAACGILVGSGAWRAGDWDESAMVVRDSEPVLWIDQQTRAHRATLNVVHDAGRWPYATVSIASTTYLMARDGVGRVRLMPRPVGFVSAPESRLVQWAERWTIEAAGPNAALAVWPAQVVDDPSSCAKVPSRTF